MNIFKKIFLVFVSLNIVIYLLFSVFNLNIIQVRMKGSKDSGIKIYYSKNDDGFSEDYSVSKQYRVEKNLKKKIFFIREEKIDNLRIDFGDCINKFELDNITVVNNMLFKETFNSDKIANDFGKNQIEVKDASNGILKFETTGNDGYIIVDNINVNKSFNKDVIILEIGLVILSAIVANIYKLVKILTKYANNKIVIYIAIVLTIIIAITVDSIFKLIYLFFVSAILLLNNKLRENA